MRLNRNTRIGLALIGVAVLVWLLYGLRTFFSSPAPSLAAQNSAVESQVQSVVSTSDLVAFAAKDIPDRSIITADMVEMRRLPGAAAASSAYVAEQGIVAGYITRRGIPRGTPLRRADLLGHITDIGIAGAVRPGFRAMAVPILNKATLHDLVKVGDYVDVLAAFDQQESRTIVQSVRVLAVDVFGKDFPQVRIAQRGDYKAEPAGVGTANPGSPAGATGAATAGSTVTTTTAGGQSTTTSAPTAAPTPAPGNGQPPPKPEPSLTLEVTPDQATAIQLAQSASAPLDFILLPRPAVAVAPQARVAASIRPRVAPYADSLKRGATVQKQRSEERMSKTLSNAFSSLGKNVQGLSGAGEAAGLYNGGGRQLPSIPSPGNGPGSNLVPPATITGAPAGQASSAQTPTAEAPRTYRIPVYGDGKLMREDVVLKPAE
ncbi:MAG TPA: Flp pilus assembly protein CpaB [Abditibacteriaceae bacterium]|jgi:Flp pilus assembly protein CpaB